MSSRKGKNPLLTQARLRELLIYNQFDGKWTWAIAARRGEISARHCPASQVSRPASAKAKPRAKVTK
jgi:hypothetical protein